MLPKLGLGISASLTLFLLSGFFQVAEAAYTLCPGSTTGITVSVIYCTRAIITDALTGSHLSGLLNMQNGGFLGVIVKLLAPYEWAAITLAVTLYGVKLVTMEVREVLKESASLLFRVVLVVYMIASLNSAQFYHSGTGDGLYGALADGMGELVAIVSTAFKQTIPGCNPAIPVGANVSEYKVWGEFDCMFSTMFNLSAPGAVGVGIIAMAGAALFSAPVGVAILMMAITLFVQIFLTLSRAIYTLLLSYLLLALLTIIAPLLIPLLVFDNGFTRDVFWKWVGMVCSTIFQPLFMIGFLAFFVMVEDQFIDGNLASCQLGKGGYASACSFKQIMNYCGANGTSNPCIQFGPLFNLHFNVKINVNCSCGSAWNPINWPCIAACKLIKLITDVINWAINLALKIFNWLQRMIIQVPKIVHIPIMTLLLSFVSFVFITYLLRDLLEVIPHLSREMTLSVGVGIFQLAQVPLEGIIAHAVKGMGDSMQLAAGQAAMNSPTGMKGMMHRISGITSVKNMSSMPGIVGKGLKGAGSSILRSIIK